MNVTHLDQVQYALGTTLHLEREAQLAKHSRLLADRRRYLAAKTFDADREEEEDAARLVEVRLQVVRAPQPAVVVAALSCKRSTTQYGYGTNEKVGNLKRCGLYEHRGMQFAVRLASRGRWLQKSTSKLYTGSVDAGHCAHEPEPSENWPSSQKTHVPSDPICMPESKQTTMKTTPTTLSGGK